MSQATTNVEPGREVEELSARKRLPPPDVALSPPPARRKDWALGVMGIGVLLAICYFAEVTIVVVLVSALIAFILAPVTDLLTRLRLPRTVAAALVILILCGLLVGIAFLGINQADNLVSELPKYSADIRHDISKISRKVRNLEAIGTPDGKPPRPRQPASDWNEMVTRGFGSAAEIILAASFVPFLVFFMLTWHEHARAATVQLFPPENRHAAHVSIGLISLMVRNFIIGNFLIALMIGALSTVVFALLHVPFFYFAGLGSGFLSLVPYLGLVLALLPPLFLGIGHISLSSVLWIAVAVFTFHVLSVNVLYPLFLGGRLRLNPLALTIALLIWAWLWGAVGLVLAIPITAAMKIVFDHVESLRPVGAWLGENIARKRRPKQGSE
ncbi:MAG: AI-2E family transporter [Acidobacteria bacterium]|nr:AI-2E family transporter [Acidobacteriota bacterium]